MSTTTTAAKARPITFGETMFRAILSGAKTQTRVAVNPQPHYSKPHKSWMWANGRGTYDMNRRRKEVTDLGTGKTVTSEYDLPVAEWLLDSSRCPFAVDGEIWVRERFGIENPEYVAEYKREPWRGDPNRASANVRYFDDETAIGTADAFPASFWRSPQVMPRWASRITLRITDVRVQRLQDISDSDVRAEGRGVANQYMLETRSRMNRNCRMRMQASRKTGVNVNDSALCGKVDFAILWDSINGKSHAWATNPWAWAISFERA